MLLILKCKYNSVLEPYLPVKSFLLTNPIKLSNQTLYEFVYNLILAMVNMLLKQSIVCEEYVKNILVYEMKVLGERYVLMCLNMICSMIRL